MTNTLSFDLDELAPLLEELARVDAALYSARINGDPIEEYASTQVSLARSKVFAKIMSAAKHDPASPPSLRAAIERRDQVMMRYTEVMNDLLVNELGRD